MNARRRKLSLSFVATVCVLGWTASAALASTPEAPEVSGPFEVRATHALVRGVLNPNAVEPESREPGTYQFIYRASTQKECKGAGETRAPVTPALSMGLLHEETPVEELINLTQGTEYVVCLVATETGKTERAVSAPATFKTPVAPATPETRAATAVTGSTATLNGVLNPGKPAEAGEEYKFYFQRSSSECNGAESQKAPSSANLPANGQQSEVVSLQVAGLLPNTIYTYCVQAQNAAYESALGGPVSFETPAAAPTIANTSSTAVGSTEATIAADIDPGAESTTYKVEYESGKHTEQTLPASKTPVRITQRLSGLAPETEYHVELTATNEKATVEASLTFKTAALSTGTVASSDCPNSKDTGFSSALPDCRAAELVSPASELGETYDPGGSTGREEDTTTLRPFRSSEDGASVAYLADPSLVGGDGSSAKGKGNEYVAARGPGAGPSGWESTNITPSVAVAESASYEREYEAFSPDLSVGIITSEQPLIAAQPNPQGPEGCSVLYSHRGTSYQALFSETTTGGYCGLNAVAQGRDGQLIYAGETSDHTQKLFQTPAALVAPAEESGGFGSNLYDSVGGALSVVNVLPGGEIAPNATYGGPSGLPRNAPDLSNIISPSGSRVIWSTVERGESRGGAAAARPSALYARENPTSPSASTVQLDKAQAGASGESRGGEFWAASSDGSKVFFSDCSRLTSDSTANDGEGCQHMVGEDEVRTGNDLYEYDFAKPLGARLTDLTVDTNGSSTLGADVQGVIGASQDGSYVYFVAGGTLTSQPNAHGETAATRTCEQAGGSESEGHLPAGIGCNLYMIHNDGTIWEPPVFIGALAKRDDRLAAEKLNDPLSGPGEVAGDWTPDLGSRTAELTPDGLHLVFESTQQLTGYNNSDVGGAQLGEGGVEIFTFSAKSGHLACASCNPTGEPPNSAIQTGAKASYPPYLPISSSNTFMHRWINNAGTEVFFNSSQPLVAGDSNGTQDVYEWAAQGTPSCPTSTSKYEGCVLLLSGGESTDFSFLVDVSENGESVFLTHRGQLEGIGPAGLKVHLFDMRMNGGYSEAADGCSGSACQTAPPLPASIPVPASVDVAGIGNFVPRPSVRKPKTAAEVRAEKLNAALRSCKKAHANSKKRRIACERAARRRYGRAAAKKASRKKKSG